jgi:hypothetical protein
MRRVILIVLLAFVIAGYVTCTAASNQGEVVGLTFQRDFA